MERYWHLLSGSEQKVYDFLLRQTIGFQKGSDTISLSQFANGIGENNKGTGLSKTQVRRAIDGLERKGFIRVGRRKFKPSSFSLVYKKEHEVESTRGVATDQLKYLISLFREVEPLRADDFLTDSRQIRAMQKMLDYFDSEFLEQVIKSLAETNKKKYAPTIHSPLELEKKIVKLVDYHKRKKDEADNEFKFRR